GAAYAFLTYLLLENKIGLGDFIMLFAAIGGLSGWIDGVVTEMSNLFRESLEQCYRRIMIDFPDISNFGQGVSIPSMETAPEIRLENVSYTYSGSETPVLENVNITIKPGERIAVVGINGAGKTTLIKLICGLYRPTTGRVLMAGLDIREYNRDEYFTLITAVFQDIFLLAESIIENVSQQPPDTTDKEKAMQCLNKAGLTDKINALSNGAYTLLVREVHEHAVDLSGGEKQKLALARALYKDAPVMILDEPTSALDPIAENEMYRQYAALTEGKTSVYISHRLASTRFCDRIPFLDGKTVAEEGSHDMLMKANGIYSQMYSLQASYYTEKKEGVGDE
ncbi:MAG: ATP-binding cassette domain-containing protein, partial [Defluviitaleaceae bacterium]|nr:ATP-binding cassette domain-containing protein [Defluviitaleaceae bacterium]